MTQPTHLAQLCEDHREAVILAFEQHDRCLALWTDAMTHSKYDAARTWARRWTKCEQRLSRLKDYAEQIRRMMDAWHEEHCPDCNGQKTHGPSASWIDSITRPSVEKMPN